MEEYKIYLKDFNVVIERGNNIYRFIPTREFRIQPEKDFILIEGAGFEKYVFYEQIKDVDGNDIGDKNEVIDYLSPFVGFKKGGSTGNGGANFLSGKVLDFDKLPYPPSSYTGKIYEVKNSIRGVVLPVIGRVGGKDSGLYRSNGVKWYKMALKELDVTDISLNPNELKNTNKTNLSEALKDYDDVIENEKQIRDDGDKGSVSIHSDIDTLTSNKNDKEVLVNNGNNVYIPRTLNLDDIDNVDTQNTSILDNWILKYNLGKFVPCMYKIISSSELVVNNDKNVDEKKIDTEVNFHRVGFYIIDISFNWSIDSTTSDFIATLLIGGKKIVALPNSNEILRKEGKDSGGNNRDGRGTSSKESFNNKYIIYIDSPGPISVEFTFKPEAFFVEASCWNTILKIEETINPEIIN